MKIEQVKNRMSIKLNVLYTNSDILTNKLNELHLLAVEHHLDIIMITEVITPQHINIEGFNIYSNFDHDVA